MTPAGHLLSGYLVGDALGQGSADRRWIVATALVGSIAPDLDVAVGLLGGWAGSGTHRGLTHSLLGAVAIAALVAVVSRRRFRLLFAACLGGVLTHIFWDWLNVWGVRPFWPWQAAFRGNLLHEGDLAAAAIVALAAICLWMRRRRAALACLVALVPAYLGLQLWWRARARELAAMDLPSSRTAVYPTNRPGCGWMVLSAEERHLRIHCLGPLASRLVTVRTVLLREDPFTRASEQLAEVKEFRQKIPFSFAEVQQGEDGGALVVWRDLRVSYEEKPNAPPTGLHVRLDAQGRILDVRHHWWLTLW